MQHMKSLARRPRGYTLIELLAVLGIIATLLTMAWPIAELSARREKERELKADLWSIRDAIDAYKRMADAGLIVGATSSGYPPSLQVLADGIEATGGKRMYFLREVPQDPFASNEKGGGWVLRSYQSSADRPEVGDDVYDVHSASPLIGLNGVALQRW